MLIEKMKEKFLDCMRHLYPTGTPENQHAHRDMIRVFAMGWIESLLAAGQEQLADAWLQEYTPMADLDWWPDESWSW